MDKNNCSKQYSFINEDEFIEKIAYISNMNNGFLTKNDIEKYFLVCMSEKRGITAINLHDDQGYIYEPTNFYDQKFGFDLLNSSDHKKSLFTILISGAGFCVRESNIIERFEGSGWILKGAAGGVFFIYRYSKYDGRIKMSFSGNCLKSMNIGNFDSDIF